MALVVKNPPANAGDVRSLGLEDPLEEGMATHCQYSCLQNCTGRGTWQAAVQGGRKESDTTEGT